MSRPSTKLGVSQSALSHTIRELEARVRLLTHTTRSASRRATAANDCFRPPARGWRKSTLCKENAPMNRFANRAAIVTGGGQRHRRSCRQAALRRGASVVVVDANGDGAQRVAESLGDAERAYSVVLDVTDRARVNMMMAEAAARFGHLHALANCAGIRGVSSVLDAEAEQWARVHAVNLEGTLIPSQEFARLALKAGQPAAIVNLSSLAGITAVPNRAPYVTSKHAVVGLTRAMAIELGSPRNPRQRHHARHDPNPDDRRHVRGPRERAPYSPEGTPSGGKVFRRGRGGDCLPRVRRRRAS